MSYQPRRVSDVVDDSADVPADEADEQTPRRAASTITDKLFHRGGALAALVTVVATGAAVVVGATGGAASSIGVPVAAAAPLAAAPSNALIADQLSVVRAATPKPEPVESGVAVSRQYAAGSLNVRSQPDKDAKLLGKLSAMTLVEATAEIDGDYRKILYKDGFGWVLVDNLSGTVEISVPKGTSMAACPRGSAVENHLRKATIFIYRSVCPLFPDVNSFGGWRAGGMQFHKNGRALDIMLTPGDESAMGWRIANYLIAHKAEFKIDHIIFEQKIWTPAQPHWKLMPDRGSVTANHFNHVHVAVTASAS